MMFVFFFGKLKVPSLVNHIVNAFPLSVLQRQCHWNSWNLKNNACFISCISMNNATYVNFPTRSKCEALWKLLSCPYTISNKVSGLIHSHEIRLRHTSAFSINCGCHFDITITKVIISTISCISAFLVIQSTHNHCN